MVGITIGLLTVAVGMGSLMISRSVSGTVTEATTLQQQANYAFRVIGQQIRQAGSLELNLSPDIAQMGATGQSSEFIKVAFDAPAVGNPPFDRAVSTVQGKDTPSATEYAFIVRNENYTESINAIAPATGTVTDTQLRDCLGKHPDANLIVSQFAYRANATPALGELVCAGADNSEKSIIQNVVGLTVRYAIQQSSSTGIPKLEYVNATTAAISASPRRGWSDVYAIEVCLELVGSEAIDTAGTNYVKCDGTTASRGNRLRGVYRNIFQIRSQGQPSI